jgi:hypothetical protein
MDHALMQEAHDRQADSEDEFARPHGERSE